MYWSRPVGIYYELVTIPGQFRITRVAGYPCSPTFVWFRGASAVGPDLRPATRPRRLDAARHRP